MTTTAPHPLRQPQARTAIEQAVGAHCRRPWRVAEFQVLDDLASHPCALMSDGDFAVFAKLSNAANAADQFEAELAGLNLIRQRSGVGVPTPIGVSTLEGGAILLLEAVKDIVAARGEKHWRDIGRALARLHQVKSDVCGLHTHGYFGPIYQDNRPLREWPAFYAERRLWPRLISAIDAGHMPTAIARQVERVIARLPELCGPTPTPVLLHGDAQQNNWISTEAGALVVDPAVHFGHPELDLAYLGYWQEIPDIVLDGYREELPIDPGFAERRDLWRISGYLAAVAVAGKDYLPLLINALNRYA